MLAIERIPRQMASAVLLVTANRFVLPALPMVFLLATACVVEAAYGPQPTPPAGRR